MRPHDYYINIIFSFFGLSPIVRKGGIDWDLLKSEIKKEDPIILDIGTNDGSHTLRFLNLFSESKVFSFEPDPRAQEKFISKVVSDRAKLFSLAISDTDGTLDFHMSSGENPRSDLITRFPNGWDMSGYLKAPKEHLTTHPWCKFEKDIQVESKRLDTWAKENGVRNVDLIWADVQGAEDLLIKGGQETLKHTRYFYTEYNNQEMYEGQLNLKELMSLLPDFRVVQRFEFDVLLKNSRF